MITMLRVGQVVRGVGMPVLQKLSVCVWVGTVGGDCCFIVGMEDQCLLTLLHQDMQHYDLVVEYAVYEAAIAAAIKLGGYLALQAFMKTIDDGTL